MIQSPILKLTHDDWFRGGDWLLCAKEVRNIFDIPKSVDRIQVRLYARPKPDCIRVEYVRDSDMLRIESGIKRKELITHMMNKLTARSDWRDVWYVELFYWE